MIPYIYVEPLRIGPLTLAPFGILVVVGVVVGIVLTRWRAKRVGLPDEDVRGLIGVIIVGALLGAHWVDSFLYHPGDVLKNPGSLLTLWSNMSSFGGFVGVAIGAFLWKYYKSRIVFTIPQVLNVRVPVRRATPQRLLPYADLVMSVFPVAWIFGRAGCAVVHDHPGAAASADSWLAVGFGPGAWRDYGFFQFKNGSLPRYDLGLLELFFTVALALAFALTWHKNSIKGWYVAVACTLYPPVRFGLDFLRSHDLADGGDERYAALTPAQWGCVIMFAFGACLLARLTSSKSDSVVAADAK